MNQDGISEDPVVFRKCLLNWKTFQRWSPTYLSQTMGNNKVKFRIGKRNVFRDNIMKYGDIVIEETFQRFLEWCDNVGKGCFSEFDVNYDWAYCSYENVQDIFFSCPSLIEEIDWTYLGLKENFNRQSVFWMGSVDSFTDCHFDTYGCNIVCQVRGIKRWLLFPPSDSKYLYPTRLPYEESSVYSSIDFNHPDLRQFPLLSLTSPIELILEPGDVLYVPRHWWHFVKTVEGDINSPCSLTINLWLDDPCIDNNYRIFEALSKAAAYAFLDSNFLPFLPSGCLINKEDFLTGDWGEKIVESLNHLLRRDDYKDNSLDVSLLTLFTNFEGESLKSMNGSDYFNVMPTERIENERRITELDILDAFTNPEVIEVVRKVLQQKFDN